MGFAINPTLNYIDLPERYVLEIHRSRAEVHLPDARFKGHTCEAYICISKVEKTMKAYVALLETGMKSVFVYTSDYSTEESADYPKVFAEANDFVTSLGFSMEKVNLEFSPAMREVIIKGFRVMRPPPAKKPVLRSLAGHQAEQVSAPDTTRHAPQKISLPSIQPDALPVELKSLMAELASAKTVIAKITREKLALEQSATREIALLKSSAEKASASKQTLEERLTKEIEALKKQNLAADSRKHDDFVATVKKELDSALLKAGAAEKSYAAEISRLNENIEAINGEKNSLELELSALQRSSAEEVLKLTRENESLNSLLSAERSETSSKISALALLESSAQESRQREEDLCKKLDILKEQFDLLEADAERLRQKEGREETLLARIAELEKELGESKAAVEDLFGRTSDQKALEVELKNLTEAKNDVEAEYIRMANETMDKETRMLETLYVADAEIVRLSRELELQRQVADMEKTALLAEMKQMILAGAVTLAASEVADTAISATETVKAGVPVTAEIVPELTAAVSAKPAVSAPATESSREVVAPDDETADNPVAGDPAITKGLINEFGGFCGSSGQTLTEFKIDPDVNRIEYSDPAEVVAILSSSNSVQAVPDGRGVHQCKGYIIAIKKEAAYGVYLLWHLADNNNVVICTPEQQPADSDECAQILQDAITYFEIVGFMMELEDLGSTVKSYNRAIRKVPALSRR